MLVLILSILALFAGPIIAKLAAKRHGFVDGIEAFLLLSIAGLVMLEIFPYSFLQGGWFAVVAAFAGVTLPIVLHRVFHRTKHTGRPSIVLTAAILGLGLHAFLDGIGLAAESMHTSGTHDSMAIAIILHRLPMGLLLWWLIRPRFGLRWASGAIGFVAAATIVGFWSSTTMLAGAPAQIIGIVQAFVAGCILHVLLHPRHQEDIGEHTVWSTWSICIGALLGIALIATLEFVHAHGSATLDMSSMPAVMAALITLGAFIIARFEPVVAGQHAHHHAHGHGDIHH